MKNRYDKYKDSGIAWIGEIPEHWNLALVKSIFNRRTKKNNPILTEERLSLSIEKGVTLYSEKTTNLDRFKEDFTQYQIAYPNDIVLNSMNMIVGAIGISHYLGCVSPVYYVIAPKDKNINVNYYGYLLNNFRIRNLYHALGEGIYAIDRGEGRINTCRLKVSYDKFGSIIVPIPSINEQLSIATYLDQKCSEIDELITLQEEMITKLQSYKQSVITEAVTKGLDKNVPLKDSGIDWKVVKIKYLAKIKSGDSISSNEIIQEGIYEVYGGNGLMGYCNKKNVNGFNIIIGRVGALCGNVRLISESKYITDNALILNCFDNALYPYMYIMLKAANLNNLNTSNAQPLITGSKVLNVSLPIPPLSEQQSITDYLDQKCSEIDELISIKQQKIEKLKDYKKSLIFECVTGKRKV